MPPLGDRADRYGVYHCFLGGGAAAPALAVFLSRFWKKLTALVVYKQMRNKGKGKDKVRYGDRDMAVIG